MNKSHPKPWRVFCNISNHDYWIVDADNDMVTRRLRKSDAKIIVKSVNEFDALSNHHRATARRLEAAEQTIIKLRAYIRDNEVKTLRGIRAGIWQEGI